MGTTLLSLHHDCSVGPRESMGVLAGVSAKLGETGSSLLHKVKLSSMLVLI